jgi:CVNH domain
MSNITAGASAGLPDGNPGNFRPAPPFSALSCGLERKMKLVLGLVGAIALAGLSFSSHAQAPPPGSYQQSCREIRMQGPTLTAVCLRANGRGTRLTALDIAHCVGDIGNSDGHLQCNGGRPAAPVGAPPYQGGGPGYPPPGYGPPGSGPPRYGEVEGYRGRCDGLRHEERELRDRLVHTPYGEERERLQYRLGQVHNEREQCWRR